jgi:hypothetical protein
MKITTTLLTHRTLDSESDSNPLTERMARSACDNASRKQSVLAFSTGIQGQEVVITAVSQAICRAMQDPSFFALPETDKTKAATLLAEQYMHGQRIVQALVTAMNNPSTLATQLKMNSRGDNNTSVFETIIEATKPENNRNDLESFTPTVMQ